MLRQGSNFAGFLKWNLDDQAEIAKDAEIKIVDSHNQMTVEVSTTITEMHYDLHVQGAATQNTHRRLMTMVADQTQSPTIPSFLDRLFTIRLLEFWERRTFVDVGNVNEVQYLMARSCYSSGRVSIGWYKLARYVESFSSTEAVYLARIDISKKWKCRWSCCLSLDQWWHEQYTSIRRLENTEWSTTTCNTSWTFLVEYIAYH